MNTELNPFQSRAFGLIDGLRALVLDGVAMNERGLRLRLLDALERIRGQIEDMPDKDRRIPPAFRKPVRSRQDAALLFAVLHGRGQLFHPEDDPADIRDGPGGPPLFSREEARLLRQRMEEAHKVDWGAEGDPCGHVVRRYNQGGRTDVDPEKAREFVGMVARMCLYSPDFGGPGAGDALEAVDNLVVMARRIMDGGEKDNQST